MILDILLNLLLFIKKNNKHLIPTILPCTIIKWNHLLQPCLDRNGQKAWAVDSYGPSSGP